MTAIEVNIRDKKLADHIYTLRNDYQTRSLKEALAKQDPVELFDIWPD